MNQVSQVAQTMFENLQRANCITHICDDLSIATKVLHSNLKSDETTVETALIHAEEMQNFITEQFKKYSVEQKQFALSVQKTRTFIHVFSAYEEECETVRNLYTDLINQQNDASRMLKKASEKPKKRSPRKKSTQLALVA